MERYVNNYYPTVDQMAIDGGVVGVNDVHMDRWTPFVLRSDYDALHKQLTDAQATIAALQADNRTYINERHENMKQIEQLQADLAQRTAELEAAKADFVDASTDRDDWITSWRVLQRHNERIEAELERVRGELAETKLYLQQERANRDSLVACVDRDVKTIKELRTLVLALPKVEGAVVVSNGYVKDSTRCHALFGADEDAALYAALLKHRQGMEG